MSDFTYTGPGLSARIQEAAETFAISIQNAKLPGTNTPRHYFVFSMKDGSTILIEVLEVIPPPAPSVL